MDFLFCRPYILESNKITKKAHDSHPALFLIFFSVFPAFLNNHIYNLVRDYNYLFRDFSFEPFDRGFVSQNRLFDFG